MRFFTIEDVPFGNACIRAYNSWAASFCAAKPDNFRAIAMIYLDDVGAAVEELERCKSLGLVGAMISVHPDGAEAYHAGSYDPFWAAAERLHMPVSLHTATERRVQQHQTPTDAFLQYTLVQRTLIGMIYAGTFDRLPDDRLSTISTAQPLAMNTSDTCEPMNPAPPVTNTRLLILALRTVLRTRRRQCRHRAPDRTGSERCRRHPNRVRWRQRRAVARSAHAEICS